MAKVETVRNGSKAKKASVKIASPKVAKSAEPEASEDVTPIVSSPDVSKREGPKFRIVTGSYEHNLLCVSLTLFGGVELFTPIFHFTAHTQSIRCLAQSKRYLVSGSNDEHIRIYDLQKRKELGSLLHHSGSITSLQFFDAKWLLSGAGDGMICIWRTKDWEVLGELKGHKAAVNDISIHSSGKLALSVADDRTLHLWNLMTARKASVIKLAASAIKVRWTLDGAHYVLGYDRKVEIYDAASAEKVYEFTLKSALQHLDVVKLGDKEYVALSHNDGKIVFYPVEKLLESEAEAEITLVGHGVRVKHFSFFTDSSDKQYMSSVSSDGKLVIWDLEVRDQIAVYNTGDRLNCCVMIPDDVEKLNTMKKRVYEDDETDYSEVESDAEELARRPKKKKPKAKVSVQYD